MGKRFEKFDNLARNRVIDAVQECCDIKLEKVGNRHKWLQDTTGRNWCVLGGKGFWHGIPKEIIEHERRSRIKGLLVIAHMKSTVMDVFKGPLDRLVGDSDKLPLSAQTPREYKFNVDVRGTSMRCREIPKLILDTLTTIPYSTEDRARDMASDRFQKLASDMSREDIVALIDRLASDT